MKFLLDANLPRSTAPLLKNLGHEAHDVRDVLPAGADDASVATYARTNQLTLITRDFDFADIRNYPPGDYSGLVILELPEDATAPLVNKTLETFRKRTVVGALTETTRNRGIVARTFSPSLICSAASIATMEADRFAKPTLNGRRKEAVLS